MIVLIACEESQTVCKAFRARGHEAYSCDIQKCSGSRPEWHIRGDAIDLLNGHCGFYTQDRRIHFVERWDLIIAHPPCTYLSNAGAVRLYPHKGQLNQQRYEKGLKAAEFLKSFLRANCDKIAVENPIPLKIYNLPPPTQKIQPYQFGDPFSKATLLWLVGLSPLKPTKVLSHYVPYLPSYTSRNKGDHTKSGAAGHDQKKRSRFFPGIAEAMAEQWSI